MIPALECLRRVGLDIEQRGHQTVVLVNDDAAPEDCVISTFRGHVGATANAYYAVVDGLSVARDLVRDSRPTVGESLLPGESLEWWDELAASIDAHLEEMCKPRVVE